MSDDRRLDLAVRDALAPPAVPQRPDLAAAIATEIRLTPQRSRSPWPWSPSAADTRADAARVRALRVAMILALVAASLVVAAVGARLLRTAPPQLFFARDGSVLAMALDGGVPGPVPALAGKVLRDLSISPDGRRILTLAEHAGEVELWDAASLILDDQATSSPIAFPEGTVLTHLGDWMSDSRSVLWRASERGSARLFLVDVVTGQSRRVSPDGMSVDVFSMSPDGRRLALVGQRERRHELLVVDVQTGAARVIVESSDQGAPALDVSWSPVSDQIAFGMLNRSSGALWIVGADGSGLRKVTLEQHLPISFYPLWSSDGERVVFTASASGSGGACNAVIYQHDLSAGVTVAVASRASANGWLDDGRTIFADSQAPMPGAPLGGVVGMRLDGSIAQQFVAFEPRDDVGGDGCTWYSFFSKAYRGAR